MLIEWCDRFVTGHQQVDHQHETLFLTFNEFDEASRGGAPRQRIEKLVRFLDAYTRNHFATEEALMIGVHYPGLELHLQEHSDLLTRVGFLSELCKGEGPAIPVEGLARLMADWLENHILRWDMAFFCYIEENPLPKALSAQVPAGD